MKLTTRTPNKGMAISVCAAFALCTLIHRAAAQGTAFTYQGRLNAGGNPATGIYDLRFTVYDASGGGNVIAGPVTNAATPITNGLFTALLDFGTGVFSGSPRWLEIAVRTNTGLAFSGLFPRQALSPTPYALYSPTAGTANTVSAGGITAPQLSTPLAPSPGQALVWNGSSLAWSNLAGGDNTTWSLNGNAGTAPPSDFLGTTDYQPLELRVNGHRAMRLEPFGDATTANVVGGSSGNYVVSGIGGATIGGGGTLNFNGAGSYQNSIASDFGTIGGGFRNTIADTADGATIAGGWWNTIQTGAKEASIAGGLQNIVLANAYQASIAGGVLNTNGGSYAAIGGGQNNSVDAATQNATIGGGIGNHISASQATISGGNGNSALSVVAFIGGGANNSIQASADTSTIAAGGANTIQTGASGSTIGGGQYNTVSANALNATIPGGKYNTVAASYSFAAGWKASVGHANTFVWSDGSALTSSTAANQFLARCTGGAIFYTATGTGTGVQLASGGGSWSSLSDRSAKENFEPTEPRAVLDEVIRMPVTKWNYTAQDKTIRHIGPMAQDFYAAFHVGEDDRHITTVDEGGVALAAIQGLNQKLEDRLKSQQDELRAKEDRISALENAVAQLKQLLAERSRPAVTP